MASWGHEPKRDRPEWAWVCLFVLIFVAGLAIVGTVEGHSLDPNTGCRWDEILDSSGVCR